MSVLLRKISVFIISTSLVATLFLPALAFAATVSPTHSQTSNTALARANHVFTVTTATEMPGGGYMFFTFPRDYTMPDDLDYTDIDFKIDGVQQTLAAPGSGVDLSADGFSTTTPRSLMISSPSGITIPAGSVLQIYSGTNAVHGTTGDQQITNPQYNGTYTLGFESHSNAGGGFAVLDSGETTEVISGGLDGVADTLTSYVVSENANHTITFDLPENLSPGYSIAVTFPAAGFTRQSGLDYTDIDFLINDVQQPLQANPSMAVNGVSFFDTGDEYDNEALIITINGASGFSAGDNVTILIGTNATYEETGDKQYTNGSTPGDYAVGALSTNEDFSVMYGQTETPITLTAAPAAAPEFTTVGYALSLVGGYWFISHGMKQNQSAT